MKLKFILIIFSFCILFKISAQEDCSDIPSSAAAHFNYSQPSAIQNCNVQIKLYYHLYYDSNGNNGVPADRPQEMTSLLNDQFAGTGISFFHIDCETRIINDNFLDNSIEKCNFFFQGNEHFDGIDLHVKDDNNNFKGVASGIQGGELLLSGTWNLTGDPLSLSQTLGHEMGHCLGLFHTHHGTCTETSSNCQGGGGDPTQSQSNGDYVNDTPRDPNLGGGGGANVNASCEWNGVVICDDNMGEFNPATDNFMAYTRVTCRTNFTMGQISRMCELMLPEIIGNSTFACCEIENESPELFSDFITNNCPDEFIDLNELLANSVPEETELVWSLDNDPSDGIILLPSSIISENGNYFAYFYNEENDCFSQVSIKVKAVIEDCCLDPVPDYIIVDENGNEKTKFCVGDQVFLNGCVAENATRYFIGLWEYEIGGFENGDDHVGYSRTDPFWIDEEPGCLMNLNEIWANFNDVFQVGHEYRIQFAVDNECTTEWLVKEDELFTMHFPTPDYRYIDENGVEKTEFCLGETVFLDGSASLDENKFFLSIWQYEIGGFEAGENNVGYSRLDPSWAQGEVGSMINLNEIWANFEGDFFEPGFEYRVQLAVKGECSNDWNVKEDEFFTVVCCEEVNTCDAFFTVDTEEDIEGNIVFKLTKYQENAPYINFTWSVYSHEKQDTGPYTKIASSNNPNFQFTGQINGCYTIVLEIETPCGNCCYSREICNENKGENLISENKESDCDIICELEPPTGMECNINKEDKIVLSWDGLESVQTYVVTVSINDPDCCGDNKSKIQSFNIDTWEHFVILDSYYPCFSWVVKAKCYSGYGPESEKVCFNDETCSVIEDPKGEEGEGNDKFKTEQSNSSVSIFPNPTSQILNYQVSLDEEDILQKIEIVNLNGEVIRSIEGTELNNKEGQIILGNDRKGIYFVKAQFRNKVVTKKLLVI